MFDQTSTLDSHCQGKVGNRFCSLEPNGPLNPVLRVQILCLFNDFCARKAGTWNLPWIKYQEYFNNQISCIPPRECLCIQGQIGFSSVSSIRLPVQQVRRQTINLQRRRYVVNFEESG